MEWGPVVMSNDSSVSQVFTTRLQQLAGTLLYDDRLIKWMGGTAHSTECIEFNRAGIIGYSEGKKPLIQSDMDISCFPFIILKVQT